MRLFNGTFSYLTKIQSFGGEKMFFNSKPLLYLQFLDRSIRYLAVHAKGGSIVDQGEIIFETDALDDGEIINRALLETHLEALVKEKKWRNSQVHILVANKFVVLREETIPAQLVRNEIKDYLHLHIGQSIRIPYEDPVFDYQVIERDEEKQKIFILAYPRKKIKEYKKILEKSSLKPVVADIGSLGLYRIAEREGMIDQEKHTLMLEWNPYETTFMVYYKKRPTFFRQSQPAEFLESWERDAEKNWVWKYSPEELSLTLNDQLNGLERFLDFYNYSVLQGGGAVTEIILTGSYPYLEEIKEELLDRFSLNVSILVLPIGIDQDFSSLYGLTLKGDKSKHPKERKAKSRRARKKSKKKLGGRS